MSSVKDPFQILADELTLIRKDMDRLERTSLDRDEAAALNEMIVASMDKMAALVMDAARALSDGAARNRDQIARNTEQAAARAAQKAVEGLHEHLDAERLKFAQSAGEARREAWRWFGGFWVWLASVGATGVALGLLIAYGTETAKTFFSVREMASYACEWRTWGGQMIDQEDGSSLCALWIKLPPQSGN